MTWLLPTAAAVPLGGEIRNVGRFDRRAYDRAYYHAKRKGRKQTYTPEQIARINERAKARYHANPERARANARANYWRHRDEYAAASRKRQAAKRVA